MLKSNKELLEIKTELLEIAYTLSEIRNNFLILVKETGIASRSEKV